MALGDNSCTTTQSCSANGVCPERHQPAFLSLPVELRLLIYKHCLARPVDGQFTLPLYIALSTTCRRVSKEFLPILINNFQLIPSINRLYDFLLAIGRENRRCNLKRLAFDYVPERTMDGEVSIETFQDVVLTRQCFRILARDCRALTDLEVRLDEKWLRWWFGAGWETSQMDFLEKLDFFDDHSIANVIGMRELGSMRGITKVEFHFSRYEYVDLRTSTWETEDEDEQEKELGVRALKNRWKGFSRDGRLYLQELEQRMMSSRSASETQQLATSSGLELNTSDGEERPIDSELKALEEELKDEVGPEWYETRLKYAERDAALQAKYQ